MTDFSKDTEFYGLSVSEADFIQACDQINHWVVSGKYTLATPGAYGSALVQGYNALSRLEREATDCRISDAAMLGELMLAIAACRFFSEADGQFEVLQNQIRQFCEPCNPKEFSKEEQRQYYSLLCAFALRLDALPVNARMRRNLIALELYALPVSLIDFLRKPGQVLPSSFTAQDLGVLNDLIQSVVKQDEKEEQSGVEKQQALDLMKSFASAMKRTNHNHTLEKLLTMASRTVSLSKGEEDVLPDSDWVQDAQTLVWAYVIFRQVSLEPRMHQAFEQVLSMAVYGWIGDLSCLKEKEA